MTGKFVVFSIVSIEVRNFITKINQNFTLKNGWVDDKWSLHLYWYNFNGSSTWSWKKIKRCKRNFDVQLLRLNYGW